MKILMINVVCGIRSTGRICTDIAKELEKDGNEIKIAYGRGNVPDQFKKYAVKIGNNIDVNLHGLQARLLDASGFGSYTATKRFIKWVEKYDPDIIHLHNIHGYYINIKLLFKYLKKANKKIIWTLHDCWSFTGHCVYCNQDMCDKWINGCSKCLIYNIEYPISYVDNSRINWKKKKKYFCGLNDITIVTPSRWLANKAKKSFLNKYEIKVINNGIDIEIFKPVNTTIKQRYRIEDKKVILGVASTWDRRKGLNDFIELSKILAKDYIIVLIGISDEQMNVIPDNIICIKKTNNINELVEWYSAAYVFVNPTYEDNYPTTNLESICCGTPVITYNTGGSSESAKEFGIVCEKNIYSIVSSIELVNSLRKKINVSQFSTTIFTQNYLKLYK